MKLRWRKDKRESGLAGVCQRYIGHTLYGDGDIKMAKINCSHEFFYWYTMTDLVPFQNTSNEPVLTEEKAKLDAMMYVKIHLNKGGVKDGKI